MKKFYSYLLSAAMLLSLAGCGSKTSNDDVMNVNIANIISADDFKFLKLEKTDSVTYYPSCKCIETIICGSAVEIDTKKWLEEPLSYLEKQGYKLDDDVLTSMLLVTNVENQKIRYG